MDKKISFPSGHYIKNIEINDDHLNVVFGQRKKIALLFVAINDRYWPYLKQVIEDCQKNFLPHHNVDYFVWTDIPREDSPEYLDMLEKLLPEESFNQSISLGNKPPNQWWSRETIKDTVGFLRNQKDIYLQETAGIDWPAPTLMRYHLFLNEEEKLKEYDYIFYLDADMRVVDKISDEVLGMGITAAEHPMYSLKSQYIPPYEPNKASTAYIHRLGQITDDNGSRRFKPYYVAGGFQGGTSAHFIEAMKTMKANIDKDFNNNYTAIWNDESHWNKYLWDYSGDLIVLSPSYIYPDSLIKEYYIPLWGRDYPPKIITITKPFSLSKEAGQQLNQMMGGVQQVPRNCPQCGDILNAPGYKIQRILQCPGTGTAHQVDMIKL